MFKHTVMDIISVLNKYSYMTLFMQQMSNINVVNTVLLVVADHSHIPYPQ